ncbi:Prohibitin-1, subunit of the prohibitin complex (Phb1p-Phb2p) [Pestalotiopsis sp. IQ-011]
MSVDPFDDVLNLEEQYYDEGYSQGYDDGFRGGKIEGRSVGMKTGYEKFLEAGRLQGKAIIWANRIPSLRSPPEKKGSAQPQAENGASAVSSEHSSVPASRLPPLSSNARMTKNVSSLHALVEPGTLSTENNDEAVNDFDDRVKRAQGKLKIVERMLGDDVEKGSLKESGAGPRNEI